MALDSGLIWKIGEIVQRMNQKHTDCACRSIVVLCHKHLFQYPRPRSHRLQFRLSIKLIRFSSKLLLIAPTHARAHTHIKTKWLQIVIEISETNWNLMACKAYIYLSPVCGSEHVSMDETGSPCSAECGGRLIVHTESFHRHTILLTLWMSGKRKMKWINEAGGQFMFSIMGFGWAVNRTENQSNRSKFAQWLWIYVWLYHLCGKCVVANAINEWAWVSFIDLVRKNFGTPNPLHSYRTQWNSVCEQSIKIYIWQIGARLSNRMLFDTENERKKSVYSRKWKNLNQRW